MDFAMDYDDDDGMDAGFGGNFGGRGGGFGGRGSGFGRSGGFGRGGGGGFRSRPGSGFGGGPGSGFGGGPGSGFGGGPGSGFGGGPGSGFGGSPGMGFGGGSRKGNMGGNFNDSFKDRYNDAYGDYQGGYGGRNNFGGGPPSFGPGSMGPPGPFGPGPMGPPMMVPSPFPPGFGYGMPPDTPRPNPRQAFKFLMKCGADVEAIKALPNKLLRLFLPDHCGLCCMDLDSFTFARMHYLSKNHSKNQKKWLVEFPGTNKTEPPLKARELYCELCDVLITSRVHAESHYAGKAHRAVVEGRRQPKNTKLLKNSMRLNKLVRREMKFLKSDAEAAEAAAAKEAAEKAESGVPTAKPTSDYYCEICKSSMSCSEQLTAHLNGKRHLAKEKQHILRMMKGGANEPKEQDEGDTEAEEKKENGTDGDDAGNNKEVENNGKAVAEGDEDWVNGTGEWDKQSATTTDQVVTIIDDD